VAAQLATSQEGLSSVNECVYVSTASLKKEPQTLFAASTSSPMLSKRTDPILSPHRPNKYSTWNISSTSFSLLLRCIASRSFVSRRLLHLNLQTVPLIRSVLMAALYTRSPFSFCSPFSHTPVGFTCFSTAQSSTKGHKRIVCVPTFYKINIEINILPS
jgi:hypothetical protein